MKNHKIFKKYKDALSYANDLIDGIKGEVLFDDAWDDYLVNGENTGDCKLYKNGKFIKTINTDDNYKWSNLIMLYKTDDGFMVYTDFEFDESKKSARKSLKEKLSKEFADLLRQLINSVDELDEYGDIINLFSSSLWLKAFNVRDRAEEILKENGLKI